MYPAIAAHSHREGYYAGYEDARAATIKEMLGITEDEENDLHDRALEMEVDARVIKGLNEHSGSREGA